MVSQPQDQQREVTEEEGKSHGSARAAQNLLVPVPAPDDDGADSTLAAAGSQNSAMRSHDSSVAGSPRPRHLTRSQIRRVQNHQREHDRPVLSADQILKSDDSMFRGLTPPPWPAYLTPNRKRPRRLEEVLEDDSPRERDKLSQELDEMFESSKRQKVELPSHPKPHRTGPDTGKSPRP